jgi:hypothetical protein
VIVEERNYRLVPGGAGRYLDAWYRLGRGPQVAHLGAPLGVYTVEVGDLNTLVYLWGFADQADRTTRRAGLADDPDFAVFRGEVRSLLVTQTNRILVPTAPPEGSP